MMDHSQSKAMFVSIILFLLLQSETLAFSPQSGGLQTNKKVLLHSSASASDEQVLVGFEKWFSSLQKSSLNGSIRHTYFGALRGLAWTSSSTAENNVPSSPVVSVPLSVVLQSDIVDQSSERDEWDAQLAKQLWSECLLGEGSKLAGYCNFLKQGQSLSESGVPTSTAPNALRHWAPEELAPLQSTPAGQKLLEVETDQQAMWRAKYDKLGAMATSNMSYEQFQWAMEVVHSRAFRGNFGSNAEADNSIVSTLLPTVLPPLGAALAGYQYVQSTPYPNDLILAGLAAVAVLPLGFNLLKSSSTLPSAVLLPMIDSANHDENADSSIEYDPLTNCFQMSIGSKCLLPTSGSNNPQLCISYGKRSDAELLLNYGFLPGVSCSEDAPLSEQRKQLAEAFNSR